MKKEPVMEIFLLAFGAFLGGIVPACQAYKTFLGDPTQLDGPGLLSIMIAASAAVVAIVTGILWFQRSRTHKSMVTTIRGRPRVPLHLIQGAKP